MASEISGPVGPGRPIPIHGHNATPASQRQDVATVQGGRDNSPIQLSADARALQTVEATLKELPAVNAERVAEIKTALSSGQYQVDELVVADRLLAMERLLD